MRISFSLLVLFFILGCNSRFEKDLKANNVNQGLSGPVNGAELVSAKLVQEQVLNSCASCHSGRVPPLLNSLGGIRSQISLIWSEVSGGFMPPADQGYLPVTLCKQEILKKWMDMGMPDQTQIKAGDLVSCAAASQPPSPQNPGQTPAPVQKVLITAALIQKPVLSSCVRCHSSMGSVQGIRNRISAIWSEVSSGSMPPSGPLSKCNKAILKKWIDLGKPDKSQVAVSDLPACQVP